MNVTIVILPVTRMAFVQITRTELGTHVLVQLDGLVMGTQQLHPILVQDVQCY